MERIEQLEAKNQLTFMLVLELIAVHCMVSIRDFAHNKGLCCP